MKSDHNLRWHGEMIRDGRACLFDEDADTLAKLDRNILNSVRQENTVEWQVPSLISEQDLRLCGYLTSFPAQLTVAATLEPESLPRVSRTCCITEEDLRYRSMGLSPAACLNIYPMIKARGMAPGSSITARVAVFRNEDREYRGLQRLWEFLVREFVFVGDREFVTGRLQAAQLAAVGLAERMQIETRVVEASDHFYPTPANMIRQKMQREISMKRELVVPVVGGEVAVSSFNFHGTHFSKPYDFDRENTVVTGCVGFGLHRWLDAVRNAERNLSTWKKEA